MGNAAAPGFASFASCADRALLWWGACSPLLTEQFSAYLPAWALAWQASWKEESAPSSLLSNILLLSCTTVLTGQVAASKVAG